MPAGLLNSMTSKVLSAHGSHITKGRVSPVRAVRGGAARTISAFPEGKYGSKALGSEPQQLSRRELGALVAPMLLIPTWSSSADETLVNINDSIDGFKLGIPEGWSTGEGQVGTAEGIGAAATRRALAWFPPNMAKDVNVTLVITNASADYTKLGSFGTAEQFGTNLVNQMDRSYLLRASKWGRGGIKDEDIQIAKLVDARDLNGGYLIEYTVQNSLVDKKYLLSLVLLGFNGRYNRLYTLTAQCPEGELDQYKTMFKSICKSFSVPAIISY